MLGPYLSSYWYCEELLLAWKAGLVLYYSAMVELLNRRISLRLFMDMRELSLSTIHDLVCRGTPQILDAARFMLRDAAQVCAKSVLRGVRVPLVFSMKVDLSWSLLDLVTRIEVMAPTFRYPEYWAVCYRIMFPVKW